jgi:hypothetical protein
VDSFRGRASDSTYLWWHLVGTRQYIKDVIFCPQGRSPYAADHDLNGFRDHGCVGRNLADMHLATLGLGPEHRNEAWIVVDHPVRATAVTFARSSRCQNSHFPWRQVWEEYHKMAGFVGTRKEHDDFCRSVGYVPLIKTTDLLEVARVIAGSRLFVGNQSCPAAIAEGLKHTMVLEAFPALPNCCFDRRGRINGWDARMGLPDRELPLHPMPEPGD